MAIRSDLNKLQLELIRKGLCTEEQVLEMIDAKKSQARKTREDIDKIIEHRGCDRSEAYKILKQKRRNKKQRRS